MSSDNIFLFFGDNSLESFKDSISFFFKITAAATTGPAIHPLPTSSTPTKKVFKILRIVCL